jgi:hypothetical protein
MAGALSIYGRETYVKVAEPDVRRSGAWVTSGSWLDEVVHIGGSVDQPVTSAMVRDATLLLGWLSAERP